jgi:stage III sporulation protein SpoIIIAA
VIPLGQTQDPGENGLNGDSSRRVETDDLDLLLAVIPPEIRRAIEAQEDRQDLIEFVLDLGRHPEARYFHHMAELSDAPITQEEIQYVVQRVGKFTDDNRAGIERTLHRISAIRNRSGEIVGLTCRVGRAVFGTVAILRDVVESGKSILLLGRPGVGKTTLLREAARVLADDLGKRVIVVDTSNEIGGDGDIPHPGIGTARRMQVPSPERQHKVMIEAVENHMPEVIVIDEIGTQAEALAARTIAERGVQLIATAHGNTLDNLLQNPTLSDLIGGIQAVTLSDEEAKRRRTKKTVLERKAPPTFNILVEIQEKDRLAVHHDVAGVVDAFLRGRPLRAEERVRTREGKVEIQETEPLPVLSLERGTARISADTQVLSNPRPKPLRIFTYGVSRNRLERAMQKFSVPGRMASEMDKADIILTLKSQRKRQSRQLRKMEEQGVPIHVIRSNTVTQMENFVRTVFGLTAAQTEEVALQEAEGAVREVLIRGEPAELAPQNARFRRLQHQVAERYGLSSQSRGRDPERRVIIYPL